MYSQTECDYKDSALPPRLCQNCSEALTGPYCASCGQHDVDYHRSFHHLAHDVLENLFHFEGKFFVSVAWLLAKPGRLTAEFNAGRRQSQLNPMRFYVFVTVLFFLGVHLLNGGHLFPIDRAKVDRLPVQVKQTGETIGRALSDLTPAQQEKLAERIGNLATEQRTIDAASIAALAEEIRRESASASTPKPNAKPSKSTITVDGASNAGRTLQRKFASGELTPSKIIDAIEQRVPTLLFLGMPLFALLLKLLYWRSGRYYIEHLVFSVHLHTWAFLIVMVSWGYFELAGLGPEWIRTLLGVALPLWMTWYVIAAFRTVYVQSWRKTIVKVALLGFAYAFALQLMASALVVGTIMWLANT